MNERKAFMLYGMEAALCFAFASLSLLLTNAVTSVMAFPYEPIAIGLRKLALSGSLGNTVSLMLYTAICLLPVFYLMMQLTKRQFRKEDGLLILLVLILGIGLHVLMNPSICNSWIGGEAIADGALAKSMIGITIDSVLTGYILLRLLRYFFESDTMRLHRCMRVLLYLLNALFVWRIFGSGVGDLLERISSLQAANTGTESGLWFTILFLALRAFAEILPYGLDFVTVFLAIRLLNAMQEDRYSDDTIARAGALAQWCKKSLAIVIGTSVSINVMQFLCAHNLRDVSSNLLLPAGSIAFVLGVLIFARTVAENRQLKADNDLFI